MRCGGGFITSGAPRRPLSAQLQVVGLRREGVQQRCPGGHPARTSDPKVGIVSPLGRSREAPGLFNAPGAIVLSRGAQGRPRGPLAGRIAFWAS